MDFMVRLWWQWNGSGQGPLASCCVGGNEPLASISS
jgi:hypothetical protein